MLMSTTPLRATGAPWPFLCHAARVSPRLLWSSLLIRRLPVFSCLISAASTVLGFLVRRHVVRVEEFHELPCGDVEFARCTVRASATELPCKIFMLKFVSLGIAGRIVVVARV